MLKGSMVSLSQLPKKPPMKEKRVRARKMARPATAVRLRRKRRRMIARLADHDLVVAELSFVQDGGRVNRVEVGHDYCTRTLGSTSVVAKSARIAPTAKMTEP